MGASEHRRHRLQDSGVTPHSGDALKVECEELVKLCDRLRGVTPVPVEVLCQVNRLRRILLGGVPDDHSDIPF